MSVSMLGTFCIAFGKYLRAKSRRSQAVLELSSDEEDDAEYLREHTAQQQNL